MTSNELQPARIGYLDPPYIGMSDRYRDHPDYDGEVDHLELLKSTAEYDGWILHCHVPSLPQICRMADDLGLTYRICSWVKTWCAFKANVPVAYAWEPVLVAACRKPVVDGRRDDVVMRDWFACPMTMQRGLVGVKPAAVCQWLFTIVGAAVGDDLIDVFPGTGAVTKAWRDWTGDYVAPGTLFE